MKISVCLLAILAAGLCACQSPGTHPARGTALTARPMPNAVVGGPRPIKLMWIHSLSPQNELAGYQLYVGENDEAALTPHTTLPYTNTTMIGLQRGLWFLTLTTRGTNGYESEFCNIVRLRIPGPPINLDAPPKAPAR